MIDQIYTDAFNDELEKLGFKFPWNKKKRKRKKRKDSWKEKFASAVAPKIKEYNLDTRFGKGLAKFMFKKGI